jgi:uncharacterized membrane protein SpoIIM required for sporulation
VTIDLSIARARNDDPEIIRYLNVLAARAHGRVYITKKTDLRPLLGFVVTGFPTLLVKRWRPVLASVAVFLVTTVVSAVVVVTQPELAYSLFDESIVEFENVRLEKQQGEYRGNFTFSLENSPIVAAYIIGNNCLVSIRAFAFGAMACIPGLILLIYNGRMLGTLTGLVFNGGFLIGFYSLIMTHGVLELSAICISGGAGFILGWALVAPADLTRSEALKFNAFDAFGLLAGSLLMLVVAGIIEAFVTPHCGAAVRWSVAIGSGVLFALYVYFGSRSFRASRATPLPSTGSAVAA